jgi:hypothetical protein
MTNYRVYEGGEETVHSQLLKCKDGDTIEFISNNQEGYMKYKVVENSLKVIDSYFDEMYQYDDSFLEVEEFEDK